MSTALGEGPSSILDSSYGAYLIGVLFAMFLQGVLTVQAWNYFESFPDDPLRNKLLVLSIWTLDTLHLVLICQTVYHYLVTNWGFQPALNVVTWELVVHITIIGLSCFICQMFFLQRIWVFSRKNYYVVGVVCLICLVTLGTSVHLPIHLLKSHLTIMQFPTTKPEVAVLFLSGALGDLLIAGLLCFYLRQDYIGFKSTRSAISQVLQYTVATGLLTSTLAVCAVIALFAAPNGLYYIAMHLSLGRLYTNSLLATLNARKNLRATLKGSHSTDPTFRLPRIDNAREVFEPAASHNSSHLGRETKPNLDSTPFAFRYTVDRITHHDGDTNLELDGVPLDKKSGSLSSSV